MKFLNNLPENATLLHAFALWPDTAGCIATLNQHVMRGPSEFSPPERELMAAYVSRLNSCDYCSGVHFETAAAFGVDTALLDQLITNIDTAPIDSRLRPAFHLLRQITLSASKVTPEHFQSLKDAGLSENAVHSVVLVASLFAFMNRYVDGLGIRYEQRFAQVIAKRFKAKGYQ